MTLYVPPHRRERAISESETRPTTETSLKSSRTEVGCTHCKKRNHTDQRCWDFQPELKPPGIRNWGLRAQEVKEPGSLFYPKRADRGSQNEPADKLPAEETPSERRRNLQQCWRPDNTAQPSMRGGAGEPADSSAESLQEESSTSESSYVETPPDSEDGSGSPTWGSHSSILQGTATPSSSTVGSDSPLHDVFDDSEASEALSRFRTALPSLSDIWNETENIYLSGGGIHLRDGIAGLHQAAETLVATLNPLKTKEDMRSFDEAVARWRIARWRGQFRCP